MGAPPGQVRSQVLALPGQGAEQLLGLGETPTRLRRAAAGEERHRAQVQPEEVPGPPVGIRVPRRHRHQVRRQALGIVGGGALGERQVGPAIEELAPITAFARQGGEHVVGAIALTELHQSIEQSVEARHRGAAHAHRRMPAPEQDRRALAWRQTAAGDVRQGGAIGTQQALEGLGIEGLLEERLHALHQERARRGRARQRLSHRRLFRRRQLAEQPEERRGRLGHPRKGERAHGFATHLAARIIARDARQETRTLGGQRGTEGEGPEKTRQAAAHLWIRVPGAGHGRLDAPWPTGLEHESRARAAPDELGPIEGLEPTQGGVLARGRERLEGRTPGRGLAGGQERQVAIDVGG